MKEISLKDLLEAGCHFGHQTTRWNPKMKPYIFMARDRIHIFDLVKTKAGLEAATAFAKATASQGGQILFIGTKRQAQDIVREAALKVGMPYITERWIGGLITNWDMLKKRINYLADLKTGMVEGRFKDRTKKENLLITRKITKMGRIFGGVSNLTGIPAAVFIADAKKEIAAVREANGRGVKVMAIVDTNANPEGIDFVIPANDDATKCLELIIGSVTEAIVEGLKRQEAEETSIEKPEVSLPADPLRPPRREAGREASKAGLKTEKPKKKMAKKIVTKEETPSAPASTKATAGKKATEGQTK